MKYDDLFIILVFLLLICRIGWRIWSRRTCQRRIRQWADENECALIRLQYRYSLALFLACAYFVWVPIVQYGTWYVTVQDSQGGQRNAWLYFGTKWIDLPWRDLQVQWA